MSVALVVLPVLWAAVRAAAGRWVPSGDDAYFTLRSLDVATSHHPLLGAWSSGSADIVRQVNNLGPFELDLLAPLTRWAPDGGTAISVGLTHIAAILTIAWLVQRLLGAAAVVPAMVGVALLTWGMGSEMLITPRQHQYLLVSYLCVLVAAWAATAGDRWAPLAFLVFGSLAAQTHLSYPILLAAAAVPVVMGQIGAARRADDPTPFRRAWGIAAGVTVVLWSQSLIDQLFGWGNLRAALASPGDAASPGLATAVRLVAGVLVDPSGYVRDGFADYDPNTTIGSNVQAVLLVGLITALTGTAVVAGRTHRRRTSAGLSVAAIAVVAAVIDASQLPTTQFGVTAANYRWLWPTAAFLTMGAAVGAHQVATTRSDAGRAQLVGSITLAVVAVLGIANLPSSYQVDQPDRYRDGLRQVADVTEQLRAEIIPGPVVIDQSMMYFGHPFAYPIGVVLRSDGIAYRFEGPQQARRFGDDRVSDGTERYRLVLWHGDEARRKLVDPSTVAFADGDDPVAVTLVDTSAGTETATP
ncbi:MAG: hypothetical protein ABIO83_04025 [Ilumatobacteraceae bacterium]